MVISHCLPKILYLFEWHFLRFKVTKQNNLKTPWEQYKNESHKWFFFFLCKNNVRKEIVYCYCQMSLCDTFIILRLLKFSVVGLPKIVLWRKKKKNVWNWITQFFFYSKSLVQRPGKKKKFILWNFAFQYSKFFQRSTLLINEWLKNKMGQQFFVFFLFKNKSRKSIFFLS